MSIRCLHNLGRDGIVKLYVYWRWGKVEVMIDHKARKYLAFNLTTESTTNFPYFRVNPLRVTCPHYNIEYSQSIELSCCYSLRSFSQFLSHQVPSPFITARLRRLSVNAHCFISFLSIILFIRYFFQ